MASAKSLLVLAVVAALSASVAGGILDAFFPIIMQKYYNFGPYKEGYRLNLEEPNGSKREEIGMILNPGTPDQQLVVMGSYTVYDNKTDIETITMYTADKDGYKSRYMLKNRKLSPGALKSLSG